MKEIQNSPACERAFDLIAFVYNETGESETHDFEIHLRGCSSCRDELASFGLVRESIVAWRNEALAGFVAQPLTATGKKSALAAFRQFFDLSPLWLKAATGFAVLSFCVLAVLVFVRVETREPVLTNVAPEQIYTQPDVNPSVKQAPRQQQQRLRPARIARRNTDERSRRPLSRAEREQLAIDLRLLSRQDDDSLNLIADRINE